MKCFTIKHILLLILNTNALDIRSVYNIAFYAHKKHTMQENGSYVPAFKNETTLNHSEDSNVFGIRLQDVNGGITHYKLTNVIITLTPKTPLRELWGFLDQDDHFIQVAEACHLLAYLQSCVAYCLRAVFLHDPNNKNETSIAFPQENKTRDLHFKFSDNSRLEIDIITECIIGKIEYMEGSDFLNDMEMMYNIQEKTRDVSHIINNFQESSLVYLSKYVAKLCEKELEYLNRYTRKYKKDNNKETDTNFSATQSSQTLSQIAKTILDMFVVRVRQAEQTN